MRKLVCTLWAGLLLAAQNPAVAQSNSDPAARANQMAYSLALKCFIAYGSARSDAKDLGRISEAQAYETKARSSFDVGNKLGTVLHYSGTRVNQDFGLAQADELPKMVKDKAYLKKTLAYCEAAGF